MESELKIWITRKLDDNCYNELKSNDIKRFHNVRNRYPNPDLNMYHIGMFLYMENIVKNISLEGKKNNLILCDNIKICNNFEILLKDTINNLPNDYDICYIGDKKDNYKISINKSFIVKEKHIYKCILTKGIESFLITKTFAKNLLNYIEDKKYITKTMDSTIGDMILEKNLNVYWCEPPLVEI